MTKQNIQGAAPAANVHHTPGPWYSYQHSTDFFPIVGTVSGHGLFHILRTGRSSVDDANARLIAAAPELLSALRDILAEADFGDPALEAKARAAIAKAEGRA
jgi:hypothetical protein